MSSNTLTKTPTTDEMAAAIVSGLSMDSLPESKIVTEHLKAFKAAAAGKARADVLAAATENLSGLFTESDTAHRAAETYAKAAAGAKALASRADEIAFSIVGAIRTVDPKMPAAQIGWAIENGGTVLPADDKRGQNIRQRWARYVNSVEAAHASAAAKAAGKTDKQITPRAALSALQHGTPASVVKSAAAEGQPLPVKTHGRKQSESDDKADKVTTAADVVNAFSHLADVVKALDSAATFDANQSAMIAKAMAKVRARMTTAGLPLTSE